MNRRETILGVEGMTCHACVRHVTAALSGVDGVKLIEVHLKAGTVRIEHDSAAKLETMIKALHGAGYEPREQSLADRPEAGCCGCC